MKKLMLMLLSALCLVACHSQKKDQGPSKKIQESRKLVLYYSQTGATKTVAEELGRQLNADVEPIELQEPYDGDFNATIARCQQEKETGVMPELKPLEIGLAEYDTIFLGYPVWFGTYASPIASLLQTEKLQGKTLITFCTFGSGGLQSSTNDIESMLPETKVIEGYGVRNARLSAVPQELNRFLIEHGYKSGTVEALPAFMEHKPVTESDKRIFNAACGDYQFPLGTPVDVAIRETSGSIDYEFTAQSTTQDGQQTRSTIYVTVAKTEGAKPEFTQVVR